jgi:hypothetical protein
MILQAVALVGQFLLPDIPGISPEWLKFGHSALAAVQGLSAFLGHSYNPDGTPARAAYDPPKG